MNRKARDGVTPIIFALSAGHADVVDFLLKCGAKVEETPLVLATRFNRIDMVTHLISQGANVNEGRDDRDKPLHEASFRGYLDIVKCLVENGANVNEVQGELRCTPLHQALRMGQLNVVEYLVTHGANINRVAHDGTTPLLVAAWCGEANIVRYLVSRGAVVEKGDIGELKRVMSELGFHHDEIADYVRNLGSKLSMSSNAESNLAAAVDNNSVKCTEATIKPAKSDCMRRTKNKNSKSLFKYYFAFNVLNNYVHVC